MTNLERMTNLQIIVEKLERMFTEFECKKFYHWNN